MIDNDSLATQELAAQTMDLIACDRENIHLIGSVQGHGVFIGVSSVDYRVKYVSANLPHQLGLKGDAETWIGRRLEDALDPDLVALIQAKREGGSSPETARRSFEWLRGELRWDIYLYDLREKMFVVEIDPRLAESTGALSMPRMEVDGVLKNFIRRARRSSTVEDLGQLLCHAVRAVTGMERVMLYRFYPPTWYGEVIAEDRIASTHSFLRHFFPASDIPKPARDLYLKNQVRFIYDVFEPTSEILPPPSARDKTPLDLSDSRLRAVSPIHIEYLKNMGVRSSFSVAVEVGGVLWGLIACHNKTSIYVSHAVRAACGTLADSMSLCAPMLEDVKTQRQNLEFNDDLFALFHGLRLSADPLDQLFRDHDLIRKLFRCEGMAFVSEKKVDFVGATPLRADIVELGRWLRSRMGEERSSSVALDSLRGVDPRWEHLREQVSGVLAVAIPEVEDAIFMLFRPEFVRTVSWGGDPRKNIRAKNFAGPINPRISFESWSESIQGRSLPWLPHETEGASRLRDLVFDSLIKKELLIKELGDKIKRV